MLGRRALWGVFSSALAFAIATALVPALVAFGLHPQPSVAAFAAAVGYGGPPRRARPVLVAIAVLSAAVRYQLGLEGADTLLGSAVLGTACGVAASFAVARLRTYLPLRAFVVPHTHWDREWYETVKGYRPQLLACVDGVIAELERAGGVDRFTFDGQTIALEDYLSDRPEMRERVDALVRAGRLVIGPWYVLSDLILVHGESTLRNLEEGLRVAAEHGRAMRVGYVADPFGHPAQMPQILRGFGYRSYVFARGVGDEGEDLGAEFEWQAPSGDRVLAYHIVGHYDNAFPLVRDHATPDARDPDLRARVRRRLPGLLAAERYANTDTILLMVGTDHTPITPELVDAIAVAREVRPRLRLRTATLEEAVESLPPTRLLTYAREMVAGRYRPILRGVNSTRIWIKQESAALERLLLRWLEPFAALTGRRDRADLRPVWRALLQCHPHDSICGCSIDAVHDVDMRARFAWVRERGESLRAELLGAPAAERPLAWSALPYPCARVVEHAGRRHLVRFAGLGSVALADGTDSENVRSPADGVLENGRLRVEVAPDASFVLDGPGGRTGPHNVLVDEGDRGDEYTYSFAGPTVTSRGRAGTRETTCDGLRGEIRVRFELAVPASLREDRRARDERTVPLAIETVVVLDAEAEHVEVRTTVENRARDHRLRTLFATGRAARWHRAAEQFAWVRRPNRLARHRGWAEQPADTAHAQDFVAVADAVGGIAVAGDGLPEYAVLADGRELALTLLRAVGHLSRGDLPERPQQAGPQLETPGAQVQGRLLARYCVVPLASAAELARAARAVRAFLDPPVVAGGGAPHTFLTLEGHDAVELSALRPGRTPTELVLRLANPSDAAATARVRFDRPVSSARPTDLREGEDDLGGNGLPVLRTAAPLEALPDGSLSARLAPYEIGTWVIQLSSGRQPFG